MCSIMPTDDLDPIDRRIIATLQADGRLSNVELAERIGLSPSPCLRRVRRLEHEGYIAAYRATLQRSRVGLGLTVFVGVRIESHADERCDVFQDSIVAMPEVVACHMVSGEADYLLEVVVPDLAHYQRFLLDKLLSQSIVKEVRSNIAIQTLKEAAPLPLAHLEPPPTPRRRETRGTIGDTKQRSQVGAAPPGARAARPAQPTRTR
jgi:Lrp/AsnC family transcriptional regulator, leucine-responsive regulatory protein